MKRRPVNRISGHGLSAMMDPLTTALIAMCMGRATADHYYDLASALSIASHAAQIVQRHKHLLTDIMPAMAAICAISDRHEQRTVQDAPYSGTKEEIDAIENGVEIYRAIIQTTPGKPMLRAINLVKRDMANVLTGDTQRGQS